MSTFSLDFFYVPMQKSLALFRPTVMLVTPGAERNSFRVKSPFPKNQNMRESNCRQSKNERYSFPSPSLVGISFNCIVCRNKTSPRQNACGGSAQDSETDLPEYHRQQSGDIKFYINLSLISHADAADAAGSPCRNPSDSGR